MVNKFEKNKSYVCKVSERKDLIIPNFKGKMDLVLDGKPHKVIKVGKTENDEGHRDQLVRFEKQPKGNVDGMWWYPLKLFKQA